MPSKRRKHRQSAESSVNAQQQQQLACITILTSRLSWNSSRSQSMNGDEASFFVCENYAPSQNTERPHIPGATPASCAALSEFYNKLSHSWGRAWNLPGSTSSDFVPHSFKQTYQGPARVVLRSGEAQCHDSSPLPTQSPRPRQASTQLHSPSAASTFLII